MQIGQAHLFQAQAQRVLGRAQQAQQLAGARQEAGRQPLVRQAAFQGLHFGVHPHQQRLQLDGIAELRARHRGHAQLEQALARAQHGQRRCGPVVLAELLAQALQAPHGVGLALLQHQAAARNLLQLRDVAAQIAQKALQGAQLGVGVAGRAQRPQGLGQVVQVLFQPHAGAVDGGFRAGPGQRGHLGHDVLRLRGHAL
ncbi:MAG: hypothetical protein U1E77_12875 [Inhella sp.]